MLSTSIKLLLRSQCCRSLISSSIREQRSLRTKPNVIKLLAGNVRFYSNKSNFCKDADSTGETQSGEKKIRRKTPEVPKITLLDTGNHMTVCALEDAVKIAEGRHLRLIKIVDMDLRSKRPVYKLMTEAQYLEEEVAEKKKMKEKKNSIPFKGEKILIMSTRITEHDFQMKLKKVRKWVEKNFEVRVTISGPNANMEEQEKLYAEFEKIFTGVAKFIQKRTKGNDLRFQLNPLPNATSESGKKQQVEQKNSKVVQVADEGEEEEELQKEAEIHKSEKFTSEQTKENILSKV